MAGAASLAFAGPSAQPPGKLGARSPAREFVQAVPVTPGRTRLRTAGLFGHGMVLQRDRPVPVWGWGTPGVRVSVTFRGQAESTIVDGKGKWMVTLAPMTAGGPGEMGIFDDVDELVLANVLVGDVWLCSGQSNMAFPLSQAKNSSSEIDAADHPNIRFFKVGFNAADEPAMDVRGVWRTCTPSVAGSFSAVAYGFARELLIEEKVPIGIIESSWGGSSGEAWTPRRALSFDPELKPLLESYDRAKTINREEIEQYRQRSRIPRPTVQSDPGNRGFALGYHSPKFDDRNWSKLKVPGYWEDLDPKMQIDGVVWYRRVINLPHEFDDHELTLHLGQIADLDNVYWNGVQVGFTVAGEIDPAGLVRRYVVHPRLVRAGANVIAIRVFNREGKGGFASDPGDMKIRSVASLVPMPLAGDWRVKVETPLDPSLIKPLEIPFGPGHPRAPSNLFNGMIKPLAPFSLTGVAWYQGETNAGRGKQYTVLLPKLIQSWRNEFTQGDLPFLIVQLPGYRARTTQPKDSEWAEIREAQRLATKLPRVGLAVTIDLGDANDIHPRNKIPVGQRLAEAARQLVYYTTVRGLSPTIDGFKIEGNTIRLYFKNTAGGLMTDSNAALRGFIVAGPDRRFAPAQAIIENESVLVSSPLVPEPVAVRYGWADNPDCNLLNRAGLPASPFRTDEWNGIQWH